MIFETMGLIETPTYIEEEIVEDESGKLFIRRNPVTINNFSREKCAKLKRIRRDMAKKYGIEFETAKCESENECYGPCEACEREAEHLMELINEKNLQMQNARRGK